MKHHKLRIAWSVAWGIVAVLLVALWVRSYWQWDTIWSPPIIKHGVGMSSIEGDAYFFPYSHPPKSFWQAQTITKDQSINWKSWQRRVTFAGFGICPLGSTTILLLPYWFCVSLITLIATVPWLRWSRRFSLRALLIAITLIAVGLGTLVWLSR